MGAAAPAGPKTGLSAAGPAVPPAKGGSRWIAAAFAALILLGLWAPNLLRPPPPAWTVYKSVKGQILRKVLADKSVMRLNGEGQVRVVYEDDDRRAAMGQAEAAFLVAPSHKKPFLISAGDREVRMEGGELNILRQTMASHLDTTLTVRNGVARVYPVGQPNAPGVTVMAGQEASWIDGQPEPDVRSVNADNAFAWETHQLAYDKAPLGDVIADLNRYVARPIRLVDPSLASLPFTGKFTLEGEDGMLRKIEADLPVEAVKQPSTAEIILRRLPACGYKNCDKPSRHRPNPLQNLLPKPKA
jgi:transmembrane sensor